MESSPTPPFSHSISGTTPHSGSISRQPTTNLSNPLLRVSSNARQFVRPDGRMVHVARSPDEEQQIRRKLSRQATTLAGLEEKESEHGISRLNSDLPPPDGDWDIVIHGSPEHVDALRESHMEAEKMRDDLKSKYGQDWDHLENVVRELDRLQHELHMVSQHAVNLDANFSKYGYSAHLRTLPASGDHSEAVSTHDMSDDHSHDWEAQKNKGEHIYFFRHPVIRQYFHKGLLWRASDATEVASYETFIDLLYVGIIAIAGDAAAEGASGHSLLVFAVTFLVTWKPWTDVSQLAAWISADDILRRLSVLLMLTILLGVTINITESYEETYIPLVAFYVAGRWYIAAYFVWMAYLMPIVRNAMLGSALGCFLPAFVWIASTFVEEPRRQALIWIALALDIFGPTIIVSLERGLSWMPKWLLEWCHRTFEFMPGTSIEHRIERTNGFVGLVFGYSVVALLYQSTVKMPMNAFYGKAVLGMMQSFAFNCMYFEVDNFNMHTHAIRRAFWSAMVWLSFHVPFVMSFTLSAATLSKLVLAHDTHESSPDFLTETYAAKSEEELSSALVWFYSAGLGIALACLSIISLSHETRYIPGQRLSKNMRLTWRCIVALVLILLPLAKDRFTSLTLIATTSSLVYTCFIVDLVGLSYVDESFWGFSQKRNCNYSASCKISKKELSETIKAGQPINVENLAKRGNHGDDNHDLIV